jgi:hypothetical protein
METEFYNGMAQKAWAEYRERLLNFHRVMEDRSRVRKIKNAAKRKRKALRHGN